MKVKELIEFLSDMDGDSECLTEGYEGGLIIIEQNHLADILYYKRSYRMDLFGDYEESDYDPEDDSPQFTGVILSRNERT